MGRWKASLPGFSTWRLPQAAWLRVRAAAVTRAPVGFRTADARPADLTAAALAPRAPAPMLLSAAAAAAALFAAPAAPPSLLSPCTPARRHTQSAL